VIPAVLQSSPRRLRRALGLLSILAVCGILSLGLWPFHSPRNQVSWVPNQNAVRFGEHGTTLSSGVFNPAKAQALTLELWIRPARVWMHGTVLSFYDRQHNLLFCVRQDNPALVLQSGIPDLGNHGRPLQLRLEEVFRKQSIFLTIAVDGQGARIYINGEPADVKGDLQLRPGDFSGQLIVANSPWRDTSWSGEMRALAIYDRKFSATEVVQSYARWSDGQATANEVSDRALLLYSFHEGEGRVVHGQGTLAMDLDIPERFVVVDQLWFEPISSEIYSHENYLKDDLINVLGFVPLGFVLAAYFAMATSIRRPVLAATLIGLGVSMTIEVLQALLPTRFSGVSDLFTNTLGSMIGAIAQRAIASHPLMLARKKEASGDPSGDC